MKPKSISVLAAVGFFGVVSSASAATIVVNPSFEIPELGTAFDYPGNLNIAPGVGWTFSQAVLNPPQGAYIAGNGSAFGFSPAPDGDQVGVLQSYYGEGSSISQGLALSPGSYSLSFYLARRPGYGINPVNVVFGATNLGTFTPNSNSFELFTTNFFATGPGTLVFSTGIFPNGSSDADTALDLITVSGVPELSTWAMMLLGFAGIGFMTYRRSRRDFVKV